MIKIQVATILSLLCVGIVNLITTPTHTHYNLALPALETSNDLPLFVETSDSNEPSFVPIPAVITDEERDCLARNIYFEAKNQSIAGQLAVGIVTLKRVNSNKFPNTICSVATHTRHKYADGFPVRDKCQFSWYCDGKPDTPINPKAFTRAKIIATTLLSRESGITDITHGADHYHADYIDPPSWTSEMIKVAQIDNHIFYTTSL